MATVRCSRCRKFVFIRSGADDAPCKCGRRRFRWRADWDVIFGNLTNVHPGITGPRRNALKFLRVVLKWAHLPGTT
jgi:hypothetical protein